MTQATRQYHPQKAGDRIDYPVNENATTCQVTIGGRTNGSVFFRYRPILELKSTVQRSDFESPPDNSISFETDGQGVLKKTFTLTNVRLSYIEIDDSGNGSLGDFTVHITQY